MTRDNGKYNQRDNEKYSNLAQLKFEYDLLSNELFHLKEYISLVEFDPSYVNDTESYNRFIQDQGLSLENVHLQNHKEPSVDIPVRRRNLRAATAVGGGSSSSPENGVGSWLKEVETLVRDKYEELGEQFDKGRSIKRPAVSKPKAVKKPKIQNRAPKSPDGPLNERIEFDDMHQEEFDGNSDNYYFTTSSEDEDDNRRKPPRKKPRIKLVVNPPRQTVTNPVHVLKPHYKSLHNYLESFKSMDEDVSIEEYENYIKEQKDVFKAIRRGLENGALRYDPETDSIQPITTKEARLIQSHRPDPVTFFYKEQNLQTYQEYLINHGVYMSKLFQNSKKARIARARKVSQMIEQYFKHIAGAEERKAKEEEKRKKGLARAAMQAVKKRWTLAERAYKILRSDEEEKLKKIRGKEHLSKMLEQSTQLLGAQLNQNVEESVSESDVDDSDDDLGETDSNRDDDDDRDDDNISSSEDDSEHEDMSSEGQETATTTSPPPMDSAPENGKTIPFSNRSSPEPLSEHDGSSESDDSLVSTESSSEEEGASSDGEDATPATSNGLGLSSLFDDHIEDEEKDEEDYEMSGSQSESEAEDKVKRETREVFEDEIKGKDKESVNTNNHTSDDSQNGNSDLGLTKEKKPLMDEGYLENKGFEMDDKTVEETTPEQEVKPEEEKTKVVERANNVLDKAVPEADPLSVVDVPVPFLLRGSLRIYQKQGLNWMASLYNNNTNGILADEMGLGKTIQTISLLAYLACEKENWGPHLIVVPTSVLLNWEMEFKRFAPGFKVLTYYGSPQQRKEKRKGWNGPNAFHICIVSYQLVVQDQNSFKRKKWGYMILDEAHNIKNFRSTRWQALLNFNTERRLLLTGTPLQNNIAELWSLLYFLMPQTITDGAGFSGFADLDAFQQWFGRPVDKLIETGQDPAQDAETKKTVAKLHQVLRPYLLRRLKCDVEKQMPAKYEHVVYCRLSKRQRFLYDDFMSRAQTKATLASGNFMSIVNCLMQLRKVCNHPDLFEVRPISTSFSMDHCVAYDYSDLNKYVLRLLGQNERDRKVDFDFMNLSFTNNDAKMTTHRAQSISKLQCIQEFQRQVDLLREQNSLKSSEDEQLPSNLRHAEEFFRQLGQQKGQRAIDSLQFLQYVNRSKCEKKPLYGQNLINLLRVGPTKEAGPQAQCLEEMLTPLQTRITKHKNLIENYAVLTPNVVALDLRELSLGLNETNSVDSYSQAQLLSQFQSMTNPLHHLQTKLAIAFPDKSLLQYDCGKLQKLAILLQNLKDHGHRALIFTQMTKVLDVLEQFLNYHGYLYMRLDGATKIEDRQVLTERFNTDPRITAFILSSRSGGLGINLTGADTVIFYDSDWNPAMDKQCQDRCHRIGQTRDVHIYRFVSDHTIESNILKKANQKRQLDNVVIQEGDFTTDYFTKFSVKELLGPEVPNVMGVNDKPLLQESSQASKDPRRLEKLLAQAEDEDDVKAAHLAMKEVDADDNDFAENVNPDGTEGQKPITSKVDDDAQDEFDEYEGTNHVEEYMIRFIANGYYYS
ncbi:SNF2 family N-terminal domain-containing protein [Zygosaccharomyces rouxii]|nr:SNF2 family N-terminal domain-containing protein [Zygosaccharomyces rouxii]